MLQRVALRSIVSRIKSANLRRTPFACQFHGSTIGKQDGKNEGSEVTAAVPSQSVFAKYGLDDWKISGPIAAAIAIPVLNNGIYVLNEETQLACCFVLFCTSVYKFGGGMIGSYFDSRAEAILHEQNQMEDININLAKETLTTHESLLTIHEDIAAVSEAHKEAIELMCQVEAAKLRHKTRETFVKSLESIREIESNYKLELQKAMVASSTKSVRATVEKGDKNLRAAAFKHALDILSDTPVNESKEDEIVALFSKDLRSYAKNLEKQKGQLVKLTDAEQKELQEELNAYMKRFNMEDAEFKAPKEAKMGLL